MSPDSKCCPRTIRLALHIRLVHVKQTSCADFAQIFLEYGSGKLGSANRSHGILRDMFNCAASKPKVSTTIRCVHLDNTAQSQAEERVARSIQWKLCHRQAPHLADAA